MVAGWLIECETLCAQGETMTKSELIERIALRQSQLSTKDVELAVKCVIDQMVDGLAAGERIEIRGFGSYKTKKKNARYARNPRTGEKVYVPEHYVPVFKFSKDFKSAVDRGMKSLENED